MGNKNNYWVFGNNTEIELLISKLKEFLKKKSDKNKLKFIDNKEYKRIISIFYDNFKKISKEYNITIKEFFEMLNENELYKRLITERSRERIKTCGKTKAKLIHKCKSCGTIKHEKPVNLYCYNRFCNCPECIKKRVLLIYKRLRNYLEKRKIKSKKLIHAYISFKNSNLLISKEERNKLYLICKEFFKLLEEKTNTKIHYISCFDYHSHIHFHFAILPVNIDKTFNSKIYQPIRKYLEKTYNVKFVFRCAGYRKRNSLLKYFAKRAAGLYGDKEKDDLKSGKKCIAISDNFLLRYDFLISDKMFLEDYIDKFYNVKSLYFYNFKQIKNAKSPSNDYELSCNHYDNFCPNCYENVWKKEIKLIDVDLNHTKNETLLKIP